jgi:hypothetical protein
MLLVAVPVLFAAVVAAVVVVYPLFPSEPRAHDSCRQLQLSLMHAWSRVVGQVLWNLVGIPEKGAAALAGIPHVLAALKRHMDCEAVVLPALTTLANALNLPGQADHLLEELPVFMLGLEKYFDNPMVNQPLLLLSLLPRFLVCLTGLRAIVGRSRDCRACGPPPPHFLFCIHQCTAATFNVLGLFSTIASAGPSLAIAIPWAIRALKTFHDMPQVILGTTMLLGNLAVSPSNHPLLAEAPEAVAAVLAEHIETPGGMCEVWCRFDNHSVPVVLYANASSAFWNLHAAIYCIEEIRERDVGVWGCGGGWDWGSELRLLADVVSYRSCGKGAGGEAHSRSPDSCTPCLPTPPSTEVVLSCIQSIRNIAMVEQCANAVHAIIPTLVTITDKYAEVPEIVAAALVCIVNDVAHAEHMDSLFSLLPFVVHTLEANPDHPEVNEAGVGALGEFHAAKSQV